MRENTESYIENFSAFTGPRYNGSLIVRLRYQRRKKAGPAARFTAKMVKDSPRRQILAVEGWNGAEKAGELEMELWFPKAQKAKRPPETPKGEGLPPKSVYWKKFSIEEIREFSRRTGDTNPIHLTDHPVVQGLLLWQQLFFYEKEPAALCLVFYAPVYSGDGIYLKEEAVNEQNKRQYTFCCGRTGGQCPGPESNHERRLCSAYDRGGVPFFSAAVYPG